MTNAFHVVIPARFDSTRFPGKLLMSLAGQSILERVYHQACLANPQSVLIATDSEMIAEAATRFGASYVMTRVDHTTGTSRIAEVVGMGHYDPSDIIVNVQGDEPFISPRLIQQVARMLMAEAISVATLCSPIESVEAFMAPHVVKVVRNHKNHALYFSRSPIPLHRDHPNDFSHSFRHIGLYAYRASFLAIWPNLKSTFCEQAECLEQLRILWAGYTIGVADALEMPGPDINVPDDLERARKLIGNEVV